MSKKVYMNSAAEREATEVGKRFMHSTDVVGDMSRAYGTDLSSVRIHADSDSDRRTAERGVDAFSTGKEVFFARAAFNKNDPASRGLLAHELSHSLQQGVGGEMGGMEHSAPMGAAQGGLIDWFRSLFKKKPKVPNKEDTLDFKTKGEMAPQKDGKQLSGVETARSSHAVGASPHRLLMEHMDNTVQNDIYSNKRSGLRKHLEDHLKGTDQEEMYQNRDLMNTSGTVKIRGLKFSRLVTSLTGSPGGTKSNEYLTEMYDNLLSAGNTANLSDTIFQGKMRNGTLTKSAQAAKSQLEQRYTPEQIQERDAKFATGFHQLKHIYLDHLRNMKSKYGTYITQMHPEDFLNRVGYSFFDDSSIMQDIVQLLEDGEQLFDFENNPDDAEFKQLTNYYFNACTALNNYTMSDDGHIVREMMENLEYAGLAQNMEKDMPDAPGFSQKEYAGYRKRLQKRFKKEKKANWLFGRFK